MSDAAALSCTGIRASYGPVQVLFDAGLTVGAGEMVALLGPNGVGKSTLLKVIAGLLKPDAGAVTLGGIDVTGYNTRKRVGLGLCQVVGQATFPSLTVTENLTMHGYATSDKRWTKDAVEAALAVFPRLHARRNQPASNLSGGERQMLALAKSIVVEPKVLVIDEFSLGLAPVVVGGLMDLVRRLNERGSAVLVVEQSVNVALSLVDRVYMMEKGEIIAEETAADLAQDPERVRALMLGGHVAVGSLMGGFDFGVDRLVIGLFTGLTYGMLAVGLVLVYRSSRFVNFAHGSVGAFGASVLALFVVDWGVPYWIAFAAAMVVAAALSGAIEVVVVRRLEGRPSLVGMIATLGLSQLIIVMALLVNSDGVSGFTYPEPTLLPTFEIQGLPIGTPYVAMLVLAPVLLIGLGWFLRHHRMGMAIRAAADDPDTARLEGIPARWMATLAWAIAGGIAAFSAILVTPTTAGAGLDGLGPDLLLKGLAGAVIARMTSIPIAIAASLGIGVIEQILLSNPDTRGLVTVVIALIIVVALLRQPQLGRSGQDKGRWRRVVLPPLPEQYRQVRSIVWLPRVLVALGIGFAVGLAYVVSNDTASVLTLVAGYTLVGLSVGLLTGVSGQLSLGQFAYAGIAAAASVHVADSSGNFLFGLLCGVITAAVASTLVGIPAMRLKGLALAVSTLAFALATSTWLLRQELFLGDGITPAKPTWWNYPLSYAVDYYLFALLVLCIGLWITNNLRHGGFGLQLQALRDNENAARAFTVPNRTRMLQLYSISGALAGLGGIVIGHGQSQLTVNSFPAAASIEVVAVTVVGGLTVTLGPLIGALILVGLPAMYGMGMAGEAALAVGWLLVVIFLPDGLGGILVQGRERLYDALARRKGIDPLLARHGVTEVGDARSPLHQAPRLEGLFDRAPAPESGGNRPILTVAALSRRFGGVVAVDHVDFQVAPGEILGVIGPNGAGKTTCFEMVAGFTRPDTGKVVFDGTDVTRATPEQRAQHGLVRSFQDAALFPTLTVRETLMVAQERALPTRLWESALGVPTSERAKAKAADEILERMRLTRHATHAVGELSTGTRRVVELGCLLTLEPRVLLLDEPSAGIAQSESEALGDLLLAIRRELGTTMVVIEHDLPLLSRLSDKMLAMNLGRVIATGTPDEVRNDPAVVRSYLGADQAAIQRSGLHLAATNG